MPKTLILDDDPSGHGSTLEDYFRNDAPPDWETEIKNLNPSDGVDYAINNSFSMILRAATSGGASIFPWNHKLEWERAWEDNILTVHAHGSNNNIEIDDPPYIDDFLVVVGGEDPDDTDEETSFGPGLEMDAEAHDGSSVQSWAVPTIAAAIARQFNRGYPLQKSRMFIRQACDDYQDGWDKETGYGTYISGAPIPKEGIDIHDPFKVEVENIGNGIRKVTWKNNYVNTQLQGTELIVSGNSEYKVDNAEVGYYYNKESHTLVIKGYSKSEESVGYKRELPSLSEDNIDRNFIDFDDNFNPVDSDKSIPSGLSKQFQIKKDGEWKDWNERLPGGYYKARIQVYITDRPDDIVFVSEVFDVTRL